jgi:RNA recognition motif-containing protein
LLVLALALAPRSIDETDADAGEEKKVKTEEEDDGGLACMVYAVGLPYTATEDEVKEFFSECGEDRPRPFLRTYIHIYIYMSVFIYL